MRSKSVTFDFPITINDCEIMCEVRGTCTPGYAGRGPSFSDGGLPPEVAEFEIESVEGEAGDGLKDYLTEISDGTIDDIRQMGIEIAESEDAE
jgi:hypothetical protein